MPLRKLLVTHSSQEEGAHHTMQDYLGSTGKGQEAEGKHEQEVLCAFCGKGWMQQGHHQAFASLNDLSRLCGVRAVLRWLLPGSGLTRAEESYLLECKNQTEEGLQSVGSGLLAFI